MAEIEYLSLVSVPLTINLPGVDNPPHGSAFFYKINDEVFLITNWHNFSGRNAHTGQSIFDNGAIPKSFSLPFHIKGSLGHFSDPIEFNLYDDAEQPLWCQHPRYGQDVDVAVIKIRVPDGAEIYPVNDVGIIGSGVKIKIGADVFILGFPIRKFTGIFPIWKRASIATEWDFDVDNLPKFLVDTATNKGMSGAPVFFKQSGMHTSQDGNSVLKHATEFLGIYSGRYTSDSPDLEKAQLGIVWREEVIKEILTSGVPGSYILKPDAKKV